MLSYAGNYCLSIILEIYLYEMVDSHKLNRISGSPDFFTAPDFMGCCSIGFFKHTDEDFVICYSIFVHQIGDAVICMN